MDVGEAHPQEAPESRPGGSRDAARCRLVHDLVAEQAERTPGAMAVSADGRALSYAELDAAADRLARFLRARGVGAETRVGVCLERSAELPVALLAVLRAGAAYVPLDPAYPAERLAWTLADSGAPVLLTTSGLAGRFAGWRGEVVDLEAERERIAAGSADAPGVETSGDPDGLAYVIYTSGSTGRPKGVAVPHRALSSYLAWMQRAFPLAAGDRVLQRASAGFDASVWEFWAPLLAGATLVVSPPEAQRDPAELRRVLERERITVLQVVPSLLHPLLEQPGLEEACGTLRRLFCGGEALGAELAGRAAAMVGAQVVNLYGPTEATIYATAHVFAGETGATVPIGRAVDRMRTYVVDEGGALAAGGGTGELYLGGVQVARGYLGRPELTAERFVPDPFSGEPGARLYRTGDSVRELGPGTLEYLGRIDHQVKIRGFRIEPGEIEAVLREQPGVREAVVLARDDASGAPGERRLVAYLLPEGGTPADAEDAAGHLAGWETVFEDTYAGAAEGQAEDPTLDLVGWNSSYTGEPIPREEMREWVERTALRILALRPERVLEIGCGTGLLLFRVAPHTTLYHGTDLSAAALALVSRHAGALPQVRLSRRAADRLEGLGAEGFDTVVLNSVARYFPGVDYLVRVLEEAVSVVRPGGRVFVGDLRSLPLLPAFHASVELFRAPGELAVEHLDARVRAGVREEQELVVDPAFWEALRVRVPRIGRVSVQVKRGEHDNEVVRYRYDVVLHLDAPPAPEAEVCGWSEAGGVAGVRERLASSPGALAVRGVPDARVSGDLRLLSLLLLGRPGEHADVAELCRALPARPAGVDPEALWALGEALGRTVELRPGAAGSIDALFGPAGGGDAALPPGDAASLPWAAYANDPRHGRRVRELVPALRASLGERLPEYMVPAAFVVLDRLPTTPNGKVDRSALPAPDPGRGAGAGEYAAPRTPTEELLAAAWAAALGLERVGVHDDFFALGGHSLLAMQVVSRVRETLRVELPVSALFEARTVGTLAARVDAGRASGEDALPPLVAAGRSGAAPLPLSFAQERLWFLHRLEPDGTGYNVASPARLAGRLDAAALERALGGLVRRHESLRTTFDSSPAGPVQTVHPAAPVRLPSVDLSGLAPDARGREARRLAREDAARPFDLARGPVLRTGLVRLAEEEHVLLLTIHHIATDGWSTEVVFRDLFALYEAFSRGTAQPASPLPPLPVQYADFALWQRGWLTGGVLRRQLDWWREHLGGSPPALELPTDRPRPAVAGRCGAVHTFRVGAETTRALRALARREGATLYMVLRAAVAVLLSRWSGQEDLVVGSPIANRRRAELDDVVGFFVNTLALRTDLAGDPSWGELLGRVREAALGAYAHQDLPFERLVQEIAPERGLSHTPLFQVMFALQGSGGAGEPQPGGLRREAFPVDAATALFDLELELWEAGEELSGSLRFRTDLFEAATMERMGAHFRTLLDGVGVGASRERRISRLPLLGEGEARRLAEYGSGPAHRTAESVPVPRLFAAQAARTPDAAAVLFEGGSLSYAELDERAARAARRLGERGAAAGTTVAVCVERGPQVLVALLAVWKAGCVYLPLDPAYPAERLSFLLRDSGARLVVSEPGLSGALPEFGGEIVWIDGTPLPPAPSPARGEGEHDNGALTPRPPLPMLGEGENDSTGEGAALPRNGGGWRASSEPGGGVSGDDLAYLIYTSGSTGTPKGVMVEHGQLAHTLRGALDVLGFGADDVVAALASVAFDISLLELAAPLLAGAAVRIVPRDVVADAEALADAAADVTVLHAVPALMRQVCDVAAARGGRMLPSVRLLLVGGDTVAPDLLEEMREAFPAARTHVLYGPTEGTVICAAYAVPAEGTVEGHPLGRPLPGVRLHVRGPRGETAPTGVPGEIWIAGGGVARGYLDRPELTAERFAEIGGERAYRTGDRARWRPDGVLEFLGRTDEQVKIRGFRIEPGEIEAALREQPGVRETVVVAREDRPGEKRLVAYVAGAAPDPAALRAALRARVPEHMVPSAFVVLESLPVTPNGKVDRAALPAPDPAGARRGAYTYRAPRTPAEERMAGIWAEVLGLERVGVEDDFFELGGHSLLATQVASRVREAFRTELPLRALFEAPTVAELSRRVEAIPADAAPDAGGPPLVRVSREGALPLSFAQQRLWFIDRLEPGSTAYNIPLPLRLRGELDVGALARALEAVVCRHEVLRTTFGEAGGEPVQVIHPAAALPLPLADLAGLPAEAREAEATRLAAAEARRPFDLRRGPLFRAGLLRLGPREHVLLLCMHHIVSDGWSTGVLFREMATLYEAFGRGAPSPLPEPPVQYADFAVWQRAWLTGEILERQLAWWRERLAGAPAVLEVPTDRPRRALPGSRAATTARVLPRGTAERLRALARGEGATLYMVLLAGLDVLLARWSGEEDVVVGTPIAGRTRRETEGVIGFFVNTLALRTELAGNPEFRELLGRVRETALGAYAHQDVPFERLVEELAVERSLAYTPLFQVVFSVDDGGGAPPPFAGLRAEPYPAGAEAAMFDLAVRVEEAGEGLVLGFTYREELWDASTVEHVAGAFAILLEAAAADPARGVLDLPLVDGAERERLAAGWDSGRRQDAGDACVHDLFAAQAARTPGAPALVHAGAVLTYAELDLRSGRLAAYLRRLGVGPETRVGICMEREPGLVVAMLGVLRAGGAYVPLDPAYPRERLGWMQEDAGVSLVLTSTRLVGVLPAGTRALALDAVRADVEAESGGAPRSAAGPESLSHVIFTSGSTGRPKGVMIRHSSVVVLLRWLRGAVTDEERSAVLFSTSINFDISVAEVFGTLAWGGKLVLVENALELARVAEPVVYASMVPTAAAELLRAGAVPGSVRTLNLAGEALPNDLAQALYALGTVEKVGNLYGPTEDTTYSTCSVVQKGAEQVFVGRPVDGTQALVLDAVLEPVPTGMPGELYLGGDGLARGYAGRPELTAESFLPNPFGPPGSRMYRVMDRVRRRANGELEYLGRTDFQVKVRGFRIEPGEIEAALRSHPAVRDAVAVVRDDAPGAAGDRRLVAYVVGAADGAAPVAAELRAHLAARLPEYMLPSVFVALETLPLTPNGKVDRRALPAPEAAETAGFTAPRTPTEEVLAGIFGEVLGAARVGVHDNFFELGGHSLLATRVVSRVQPAFGVELPLRAVFEAQTVAALAARVDAERRTGTAPAPPPLAPVPREGRTALPPSFAQRRLWFIDRLEPGSTAYNVPLPLRLRGALDARTLERAIGEVVRRHESLRTVFGEVDGEPVQTVRPAGALPLPVCDLSGLPEEAREAESGRLVRDDARRRFDLCRGPLFRAGLLRLAADRHVLVLAMHHIVTDGWSTGVLFRELAALYPAYLAGEASPLAEPEVQYADYAAWQRSWLEGEALERQVEWWRERLAGAPAVLGVPTDRPRRALPGSRGATVSRMLPRGAAERLRALARREGATLHMVLLAALDVLLARWSGDGDLVVGTPVAGRTRREVEGLIGFFVNTLALRADVSGTERPSFRELLGRVREGALGAYTHQDLPFERLVEALGIERSPSHAPLFQVVFSLEDGAGAFPSFGGVEAEPFPVSADSVKTDLDVVASEREGGLELTLTYREELWDASTVERVADAYAAILEAVAADSERRILDLPLATEAERERVLRGWSAGPPAPRADRLVHERVAEQAARTPGAVAVTFGSDVLTYAELDAWAVEIARALCVAGVRRETRVGVCLERSPDVVAAILGVLRSGGAYVPLDPAYPAERLSYMLEDSGAAVLLTQQRLRGRLPAFGGEVVVLDGQAPSPGPSPNAGGGENGDAEAESTLSLSRTFALSHSPSPEDLAYVIYTSGSTGRPKGVMVPHGAVAVRIASAVETYGVGPGSSLLESASFSFDASVLETFLALASGATLHLADRDTLLSPEALGALLREREVDTWVSTPALAGLVAPGDYPALRTVSTGGEAITAELVERWASGRRMLNLYGPTETTVYATLHECRAGSGQAPPIGRPAAGVRAYVLDERGSPVPAGFPGELHLGGTGVARGYVGRPELTAESFVPDPFAGEPGARMYRTGDRVRWLASGELAFLGRVDEQVKLRGFRIEPGEVEAALAALPGVREAAVRVREDAPGERRLVGYVAPEAGASVDLRALREGLRRTLPEHIVPAALVVLDALPRTAAGKVDRRALPAPDLAAVTEGSEAPRTATEEVLAGIWATVLGLGAVGRDAGFFELGGHSLLATRVVARVREALGVELPLRAVFEAPTLAGMAERVDALLGSGAAEHVPPLVRAPRDRSLPLSFAQQRLWFIEQLEPGTAAYALTEVVRLRGRLDAAALGRALDEVVRRHEALRTVFAVVDGEPVQVVRPAPRGVLAEVELVGVGASAEAEARRLADAEVLRPFDLERGPLFRAALLRAAPDDALLLVSMHHAVSDGWSMGVLRRELSALYAAFSRGGPSPLPELPFQYADYAAWQRAWLSGDSLDRQMAFWRGELEGAPPLLELPTDFARPAARRHRGRRASLLLPPPLADRLQALSRREGATLFMTLLAAWKLLLARQAGQQDVVVGTPVANRTRTEAEGLIGFFVNTLALRTDLSGDPSFRELLRRVRETTLGAYQHQDLPFEQVLEAVRPGRSLSHAPLFQVFFNLFNFEEAELHLPGLAAETILWEAEEQAKFDLTLYVIPGDDGIRVEMVYDADLFEPARMAEMLEQYRIVLAQAAGAPEALVGTYSLLTPSAREHLPDPARPLGGEWLGSVPALFAEQARRAPERLAVEDAEGRWSYGELDARASQLAHHLLAHGVEPGDVVAVYGHRGAPLVWALLGILRAGAAFLVLDPAYPALRLASYLRIARPAGWLRIATAGDAPAEVEEAAAETARCILALPDLAGAARQELLDGGPADGPAVEIGPDSLAYLSFTSGTTGTPRAVMGRHGSLTHFLPWLRDTFGLDADDRFTLLSGLAHDPLQRDVFTPLQLGAAVCIPDPAAFETRGALARWMREARVTVAHLTPAMGKLVTDVPPEQAGDTVDSLRHVFLVGEALTRGDVARLRGLAPAVRVVNYYGSTETQRAVGWFDVPAGFVESAAKEVVPLGRGIRDVQVLVLNAAGELAGVGEVGEVHVRSPHVALGYLGDPELTAERFLANPLGAGPDDRVYRTGDLGRYRPDGVVEPLGRADGQVKVRGFRVELGEVEATLAAHPAVREVVVAVRVDAAGERRLAAYVVPAAGALDAAELRGFLRARLPEYMVPAAFASLESLPLTPNGKVDRGALPEPGLSGEDEPEAAPRTPTEEVLAGIWARSLGVERVGADADYFALGGHSLAATGMISRVRAAFGVEVPLRAVFEAPVLRDLAGRIDALLREGGGSVLPPLVRVPRDFPLPLSFAQQRLWFIEQLNPGASLYNLAVAFRLRGAPDPAALRRAISEVARRHEALRTRFADGGGEPVQVIDPPSAVPLPLVDLGGLREEARAREAARLAGAETRHGFDLRAGPLFRAVLLRVTEREWVLLATAHHAVWDGWSTGVFIEELAALYPAFSRGEVSPLTELAFQYADYAAWQRAWLDGEALEAQLAWWRERLAGAPPLLELPVDFPRPAVPGTAAARLHFAVPEECARGLRALARGEGATLFMALLAAWQTLLARYAGEDQAVSGAPVAGRRRPELEPMIGFFVNTLALRTDLSGDPAFAELLGRVREATLGAYQHQDVPFERLVEELGVPRSLSHSPVFQNMFGVQDRRGGAPRLGGLRLEPFPVQEDAARTDLALTVVDDGEALAGVLVYRTDLWEAATMRRLAEHYTRLLEDAAAAPERRLSELRLLGDDERAQLLHAWKPAPPKATPLPVHLLIAEQAARTPHAAAVACGSASLTYAELDHRSDVLARALRERGVRPETAVGLCVERSTEMVAAVLGILKAGGVFVPLDPQYPAERLAFALADSGARVLLTDGAAGDRLAGFAGDTVWLDGEAPSPPGPLSPASGRKGENDNDTSLAPLPLVGEGLGRGPHLAYVIYTSGSTGTPKGVAVTHASLSNTLLAAREAFGFGPGDTMASLASFAFDIWLFESLLPLACGATVRVVPRERVVDVAALAEEVADATLLHAVPALMRQLVDEVAAGPGTLPGLRAAFVGGDAVPPELPIAMREVFPAAEVRVLYGPTEGTVICAVHAVAGGEARGRHLLGGPLGNAPLYVLDAGGVAGEPAPLGVPGELCIGGASVARGYLGRQELTAERFVPDPFSAEAGARMYRTGDRARWDAGGVLEFLGRTDQQVKVRGFRIEPGEVEAALAIHPRVREAVVVARDGASGGEGDRRLVAYVVPAEVGGAELWPSIGEYFVYDELIYQGLTHDTLRNQRYLRALQRHAPGKVVLDVGTGADAILARLAVEAGARHVYAVELLERSFLSARERIRELGLEDRVTVVHGDARFVELPEPADVCVSEIVESIAGGEGAALILDYARRLLAPGAAMIPGRAWTRVAAVTLPEEVRGDRAFPRTAAHYVRRIWEQVGHPFDLRLCIRGFPADHVLSTAATYEELDFAAGPAAAEYVRHEELTVERAGRLDGLLLWLRMELAEGEVLDILEEETAWFPVYFPLFDPGVEVAPGDRLRLECFSELPEGGVAPDYGVRGALVRAGGGEVPFEFVSVHHAPEFRASPFYRRLFAEGEVAVREDPAHSLPDALREHLRARLPEHMVPSAIMALDELPLTRNGKVDRAALPAPDGAVAAREYVAPSTAAEAMLAGIWAEVLGLAPERVGVGDSFFELGGHSLLATRAVSRVRAACGVDLPVRALFETRTLAELAERVDAEVRASTDERELEEALEALEGLSDEDIKRLTEDL